MRPPTISAGPLPRAPILARSRRGLRAPIRKGDGGRRVLLLHGLSGSPREVHPFATALVREGFAVYAPLLPGHEDVASLARVGPDQWWRHAGDAFDRFAAGATFAAVLGFSMGALLALRLAAARPGTVGAVVLVGTPLRLSGPQQRVVDLLRRIHAVAPESPLLRPVAKGLPDVRLASEAVANPGLSAFPGTALACFGRLQRQAAADLPKVRCPACLVHGLHDHTAPVRNVQIAATGLGSTHIEARTFPRAFHLVGVDLDGDGAAAFAADFLHRVAAGRIFGDAPAEDASCKDVSP